MKLFVDQLTNVDFSYLHPQRGLLGETWLAGITLEGELDEQGMVCDFGIVKKITRTWLDAELDHRLAVPVRSPRLTLVEQADRLKLTWQLDDGSHIFMSSPRQAVALVDAEELNVDSIARWCESQLSIAFAQKLDKLTLDFATENIDGAFYHYSHGLKKHDGNCQRIAHGHRSRINIWQNGNKAEALEQHWAELWRDIYIGTGEDLSDTTTIDGVGYYTFTYSAAQGEFTLTLPARCCYLIDTDSTVENLAAHILAVTAREYPEHKLRIRAFEGAGKGAEVSNR